jgi:hypothetical protein
MNINKALNRTAFFLIAILLVLIALSAIIPQQEIASGQILDWQEILGDSYAIIEKLSLDRIYYTPFFFIILGLLGINLIWGNTRRFRTILKSNNTLVRVRYLGSIVFHLSLLVIIAGIILNFLYKYEGVMALTEGQRSADHTADYFREFKGPLYKGSYGNFTLKLDTLRRMPDTTDPGGIATITLSPTNGNPQTVEVSINHPYKWRDIEFHIGQKIGYSPEIRLLDRNDSTVFRAFMRVAIVSEEDREVHRDFVFIPDQDLQVGVEVIPSATGEDDYRFPVAREALPRDRLVAATGTSPTFPEREVEEAKRLAAWSFSASGAP